jgi:hypothetical protein
MDEDYAIASAKLRALHPTNGGDELKRLRAKLGPDKSMMIRMATMVVAEAVPQVVSAMVEPLIARIKQQDARIKALEERPELKYCGTWVESTEPHLPGTLVTDKGGLWLCMQASNARPGINAAWRLIVKRGEAEPPPQRFPTAPRTRRESMS